ncbi:MAG: hypothetical protein AABW93_03160 [Nanoarchaeota archaeon]
MASTYQTLTDVFADVRFNAQKDSTTLPNADLFRLANKYFNLMFRELVGLHEDLYGEISAAALVASQREYALPTDSVSTFGGGLIKLQRVEITYDGTNWYVADPLSLQEISGATILDADLNAQFSKSAPRYWFKDRSVWIAPIPASTDSVAGGNTNLRIYWIKRPLEMTVVGDIPEIPKDFLNILVEGMLIDVFRKYGRISDMREARNNWAVGIDKMKQLEQAPDDEQPFIFMSSKKDFS